MSAVKLHSPVQSLGDLKKLALDEANKAEQCGSEAVQHAWQAGRYLIEIKESLPHGEFGEWLKENWPRDERTAFKFMQIGEMIKLPRVADLTSINEALRICQQEAKPKIRERVLSYITENPDSTDEEIAAAVDEKPSSVRGRRNELCKDGLVVKTGEVVNESKKKVATYRAVNAEEVTAEKEDEPLVELGDALRAASRCKSIDANYLAEKTGISKSKIQAWLELSGEATGYKAVRQPDKTFAVHRVRIKSDAQKVKEVKKYSLHGDATPAEHLSADLDSIANTIEGVIRLYSPGCKDFSAWNRLKPEDRKNLKFLLTSAMAKVNEQFPYFLGLVAE